MQALFFTLRTQIAEKLSDEAQRFSKMAQESRIQCAIYRRAALRAETAEAKAEATEQAESYKESVTYFQRMANSNARALEQWARGVRPELLPNGAWMLPSKSDGVPHILTKSGDWVCTCAAGGSDHWAKSMLIAIEIATDEYDAADSADTDEVNTLIAEATQLPQSNYDKALADLLECF